MPVSREREIEWSVVMSEVSELWWFMETWKSLSLWLWCIAPQVPCKQQSERNGQGTTFGHLLNCSLDIFFFKLYIILEYIWINDVVIVSGGQQRNSAIQIHVSIFPEVPTPSKLPHNIRQFPVLYIRSLLVIHFKHSSVYMSIPNSLTIPSPILGAKSLGSGEKASKTILNYQCKITWKSDLVVMDQAILTSGGTFNNQKRKCQHRSHKVTIWLWGLKKYYQKNGS